MSNTVPFDEALRTPLLWCLAAWAAWWAVAGAVAVVDRRWAARFAPPLLRSLLTAGVVATAVAPARADEITALDLDGLPLPQRPTHAPPPPQPAGVPTPAPETHLVAPGDCLWSIVRDRSPDAEDAEIAAAVAAWHAANRAVIGPNPDLIQPGQRLVPPGES